MIGFGSLRRWGAFCALFLLLGSLAVQAQTEPEWRSWTSPSGAKIEAYLKEVRPQGIVIVRRDGQEFIAPLERFSEEDRTYVAEWLQKNTPGAEQFRALDLASLDLPQSYTIENVSHVAARGNEPQEYAALKMVLDFHGIPASPNLLNQIQAREEDPETLIPPRDLANALQLLPLETEVFLRNPLDRNDEETRRVFNAIKKAITLDLPVIVGHRPYIEEDTPEFPVVATAYDRRNLQVLEPEGSQRPIPLDWQALEDTLIYAFIIFPKAELPTAPPSSLAAAGGPPTELLSRISRTILELPTYESEALVEGLQERGIQASVQDINRTDLRTQLGNTRSFAREAGIPMIDAALERGQVVVIPQEFTAGAPGFALVYGRSGNNEFSIVEFFPDRTFNRRLISPTDLAQRWITRVDRTYRLDLIHITPTPHTPPATPETPPPPPRDPPPGEPPAPPRN